MINIDNWITGEKFVELADFVYYPKGAKDCNVLENTFCPCAMKERNIIYTHTLYVKQLFEEIKQIPVEFIIITHNCDENVDESYEIPGNVIRWFAQNVNHTDYRIEAIPIGLENSKWFKNIQKKNKMKEKLSTVKFYKNLAYLNLNVNTNPELRLPVYKLLEDKPWVTTERKVNGEDFDSYIDNIYNHKYVICPEGNGMDTHRFWETLYLDSIPVVKKNRNNVFFNSLPVCYVEEWEEVTEERLKSDWNMLEWNNNKEMLDFSFWKERILRENRQEETGYDDWEKNEEDRLTDRINQ